MRELTGTLNIARFTGISRRHTSPRSARAALGQCGGHQVNIAIMRSPANVCSGCPANHLRNTGHARSGTEHSRLTARSWWAAGRRWYPRAAADLHWDATLKNLSASVAIHSRWTCPGAETDQLRSQQHPSQVLLLALEPGLTASMRLNGRDAEHRALSHHRRHHGGTRHSTRSAQRAWDQCRWPPST
jgi:hypothetical protein